jgi:hypothetical protein
MNTIYVVIETDIGWPEDRDADRLVMAFPTKGQAEYLCAMLQSHCKEEWKHGEMRPIYQYLVESVDLMEATR